MEHPENMTPDQAMLYTQKVRLGIVKHLTSGKEIIPEDEVNRGLLIKALDGLDKQSLGIKKIQADERAAAGMAGASQAVAELLKQLSGKKVEIVEEVVPPQLGTDIPAPVLNPGETDINPPQLTYDIFMSMHGPQSNSSSDSGD